MPDLPLLRTRWAAIGAAVAVTLGAGSFVAVEAAVTSGERTVFVSITPCRLVDTRPSSAVGPKTTPIGAGETHTVTARGTTGDCTIPTDAVALSLNVTALGATLPTFLAIWPAGADRPDASSLNPSPGQPPTPNAVTTDLSGDGRFSIFNLQGNVDVLVDVNGYYADHNHDDRYPTRDQAASLATPVFTTITYDGSTFLPSSSTSPAVKVRDLGTFWSSGGTVKITWTSHIGGAGAACNFGIRVGGVSSVPADSGLSATWAVINGTVDAVPATTVDVFTDLPAGEHVVELWYRSVSSSCAENVGNYTRTVLVEEYPT